MMSSKTELWSREAIEAQARHLMAYPPQEPYYSTGEQLLAQLAEIQQLRQDNAQLQYALEQSEAKHTAVETPAIYPAAIECAIDVLSRYRDNCTCEPCSQCSQLPNDCSGTPCAQTCDCTPCDHCQVVEAIEGLRAAPETPAVPMALFDAVAAECGPLAAERVMERLGAAEKTPAFDAADAVAFASEVIQRVCELPDRSSPEDEPEALVCSPGELEDCIVGALESRYERATGRSVLAGEKTSPVLHRFAGVGELERSGYIPAGSAAEREALKARGES